MMEDAITLCRLELFSLTAVRVIYFAAEIQIGVSRYSQLDPRTSSFEVVLHSGNSLFA